MRNQYKVLFEKYELVQENEEDDLVAGAQAIKNLVDSAFCTIYAYNKDLSLRHKDPKGIFYPVYGEDAVVKNLPTGTLPLLPDDDNIRYKVVRSKNSGFGDMLVMVYVKDTEFMLEYLRLSRGGDEGDLEIFLDEYWGDNKITNAVNSLEVVQE